jgi:hypothetical protein
MFRDRLPGYRGKLPGAWSSDFGKVCTECAERGQTDCPPPLISCEGSGLCVTERIVFRRSPKADAS